MRTLRNVSIGVVFGVILTFEVLWTESLNALAAEYHKHRHAP